MLARTQRAQVANGLKEVRDRIGSVKNTQKITEAMKLVAAAKVRRAQDAVINSRPFTENLVKVRYVLFICHTCSLAHCESHRCLNEPTLGKHGALA